MEKKVKDMTPAERKAAGVNRRGAPRQRSPRKGAGSGKVKFPCGHVGRGRFCHLCRQIERGELVAKGDKFVPRADYFSDKALVKWIRANGGQYEGSKASVLSEYCRDKGTTPDRLRTKVGGTSTPLASGTRSHAQEGKKETT